MVACRFPGAVALGVATSGDGVEASVVTKTEIGVWLAVAAAAFAGVSMFGEQLMPARLYSVVRWSSLLAFWCMAFCWFMASWRHGLPGTPDLVSEIQDFRVRSTSSRFIAGENIVETQVLLRVAASNASPVPATLVAWNLRAEIPGKDVEVEGPLFLSGGGDAFGLSQVDVTPARPATGSLAFLIKGATVEDIRTATLVLQVKDDFGRIYQTEQQLAPRPREQAVIPYAESTGTIRFPVSGRKRFRHRPGTRTTYRVRLHAPTARRTSRRSPNTAETRWIPCRRATFFPEAPW